MPSRPFFKAYTHVDPFLHIPDEQQGTAPPHAAAKPADPHSSAELATSVGSAVQHLFDVQLWNWTLVELGQIPACLFGAVSQNGFGCPMIDTPDCKFDPHTHRWPGGCKANVTACKQSYQAHDDAGNLPWTTSMITMGQAYKSQSKWAANFSGQDWVLDRVVAAIDVHVRAQGSNGGFRTPGKDGSGLWVGGPHRIPAGDPLEGWGHTSLARAFADVHPGMVKRKLLEVQIDADDDPTTPNITRSKAYLTMFNMSRSYLYETGSTYCPNQELGDAKGVWAANHAVALLDPALAWSEDEALAKVVLPALGLANWSKAMWRAKFGPNVTIPAGNWVEISPAGISLEWGGSLSGGYSAGYSDILGDLDTWAAWAQAAGENRTYEALKDVLLRMAPAFANFRLPATCHDQISSTGKVTAAYRCLKNTAFITYRNNLNPAEKRTPIAPHTALVLKDPVYTREIQLYLQWAGTVSLFDEPTSGPHWSSELMESVPFAESFDALMAMPASNAKLPHEEGHPDFAWADNVGRSVVARKGEERLFVTMQWRHDDAKGHKWTTHPVVTANGICRVQLTNATVDRLATVGCSAVEGQPLASLHVLTFGHWLVAMNSDLYNPNAWAVPKGYVGKTAREMLMGTDVVELPRTYSLAPNQTMVLYVNFH